MTKLAAAYLRSSKDRAELGIDAQRAELISFSEQNELQLVFEFSDMELSGSGDETTRPGLRNLLAALKAPDREWTVLLAVDTSRIARDPMLGIYIQRECEKVGVEIQFSKMAIEGSSPFGEMMLNVARAFDRLHARLSGEKGKAGQLANINKGFRSGGRAPLGYRLEKVATGGVRGGQPVTKSKLVPDPLLAPKVAQYLALRAEGITRAESMRRAGLTDRNPATMIGVEANALVYTGHLVWNRRKKQRPSREDPHQRMLKRDADEWIISEEQTHEPLIGREQAEAVLANSSVKQKQSPKVRREDFILSGLLHTPDGVNFWADAKADAYRAGQRGKRISRWLLEEEVINSLQRDSQSPAFQRKLLKAAKNFGKSIKVDVKSIDAEISEQRKQLDNLLDLVASGSKAAADKVSKLEAEIDRLGQLKADQSSNLVVKSKIASLDQQAIAQWLVLSLDISGWRGSKIDKDDEDPLLEVPEFIADLEKSNGEARLRVRRWITSLLSRIVYDPETRAIELHYRWGSGVNLASPRGFEPRYSP